MLNKCRVDLVKKHNLRFQDRGDVSLQQLYFQVGPIKNIKYPYIIPYLGVYEENKYLVLVSEQHSSALNYPKDKCSVKLEQLLPVINALSYLHKCGICHTNITQDSIIKVNGIYRLTNVGENYLYNENLLSGNKEDVMYYDNFFTKKKDYVKLKAVLIEYIIPSDKLVLEKIFEEIEECKDERSLDGLEIFKKHIKKINIDKKTIQNNEEWYKLAYFENPSIKIDTMNEFIKEIRNLDSSHNIEGKYYLCECYLNYKIESGINSSRDTTSNEEFELIKKYFFELINRNNNNNNNNMKMKEIDEKMPVKEIESNYTIEEILNNRNTTKICLENKLRILNDCEIIIFSILLTYYPKVKVLRLGKNYFDDLATRNIIKGIKNYTQLEELNMKMSHFSFISLKLLSKVVKNNRNFKILNLRCCREYEANLLHIKKWDDGLKLVIDSCPNLRKLSLRSNDIKSEALLNGILDGIGNMTDLEILNLQNNNLGEKIKYYSDSNSDNRSNSPKKAFAEDLMKSSSGSPVESIIGKKEGEKLNNILKRLKKLKKLDLSLNSITPFFNKEINYYDQFLYLEKLDLSNNKIDHKEDCLKQSLISLHNLKEIILDNNKLDDKGVYNIFKSLSVDDPKDIKLPNLEKISLNKTKLSVVGFYHFVYFIKDNINIKYLSLNGNFITPSREDKVNGINLYAPFYYLRYLTNLEHLDLSKNMLGKKGAVNLSFYLKEAKSLKYLNISKTSIASEGLYIIVNAMKKSCKRLEEIVLNDILLDMNGAIYIEQLFRFHPSIKKIDFAFNGFSLVGNNLIINSFSNKENLEKLILKGEILTAAEITTLSAYIKNNTNLKVINLDYSKFNDTCMENFSSSFISLPKLEELSLENCYIMNDAVESLCKGLTDLKELKKLNLSKNTIDNNGVLKLCNCFSSISKLESLDLSGNNLLKEGVMSLCDNFSNLPFLHELNLIGNNCGQEGANYLLQYLKNNKRIDVHNNFDIISKIYKEDNIKKTVFLIKGEDRGKKAWYYVSVNNHKIADFLTALGSPTLNLDAYGTIVNSAFGTDPSADERIEIRQKYPFLY